MKLKILMLLFLTTTLCNAQTIEVTYDKTVHIVFPSPIVYVDLGSEKIIASIVEEKPEVLRIKAAEKGFKEETNLSVILQEEKMHCFNIRYTDSLKTSVYYPSGITEKQEVKKVSTAERILREDKERITSIGCSHHGLTLTMKSLYCDGESIFIHLQLKNRSLIPYTAEAVVFTVDRIRNVRRGQPMGEELEPSESAGEPSTLQSGSSFAHVAGFPSFTFRDDEVLRIQIFEKGGSRHMGFDLDSRSFKRLMEKL